MGGLHVHLLLLLIILLQGIQGQVISPSSMDVAIGDDVLLACTTGAPDGFTFTWNNVDTAATIYSAGAKIPPAGSYDNFYLDEDVAAKRSILNISNIQLQDNGSYRCIVSGQGNVDATVNVEVQATRSMLGDSTLVHNIEYIATCEALDGRPEETITWILGDSGSPCVPDPVETNPDAEPDFFSKRSVCTFRADSEYNGQALKCVFGGHQVTRLNGELETTLNIQSAPASSGIMTVDFQFEDPDLTVSCEIADEEDQPNPRITNYYILSNDTLIHESTTEESSVVVAGSDFVLYTDFTCVAGNYLGNTTSQPTKYEPPRPITPTPTAGTKVNAGAIAGGVVGGVALVVIILLVIKFVVKPDWMGGSGSSGGGPRKPTSSAVGSSNGNEKEKIKPSAAPRTASSIQHTTDNPDQAEYAMVDRKPAGGKGGGDMPDTRGGYGAGQNEPGMVYADLDLSSKAGHTERQVPKDTENVVVYSSILV